MSKQLVAAPDISSDMPDSLPVEHGRSSLPFSARIMFDRGAFSHAKEMADMMATAAGYVPRSLVGKPGACFAVICEAMDSGLSPFFLARHIHQIETWNRDKRVMEPGSLVYSGAAIRAKLDASGFFEWIRYDYEGDWTKVQNRWEWQQNDRGKRFQAPAYTAEDEQGLMIVVRAKLRNRPAEDELAMALAQMHPRNSTLWATDPRTQATYCAIRRFANVYAPHALGGMKFEDDEPPAYGPEHAKDVTPPDEGAGRKSRLDAFAERHSAQAPAEPAQPSQSPQDERNGETPHDADTGEIDGSASSGEASDAEDDGAGDLDDIEVQCVLVTGKPGPKMPLGKAEAWMQQQAQIVSMTDEKWQALLEHNRAWIGGLPAIRQKALAGLFGEARKTLV